jgi:hypothetical protein
VAIYRTGYSLTTPFARPQFAYMDYCNVTGSIYTPLQDTFKNKAIDTGMTYNPSLNVPKDSSICVTPKDATKTLSDSIGAVSFGGSVTAQQGTDQSVSVLPSSTFGDVVADNDIGVKAPSDAGSGWATGIPIIGSIVGLLSKLLDFLKSIPNLILAGLEALLTKLFVPTVSLSDLIVLPHENSLVNLMTSLFSPFMHMGSASPFPINFTIQGITFTFNPTDSEWWSYFYNVLIAVESIWIYWQLFYFIKNKFNIVRTID